MEEESVYERLREYVLSRPDRKDLTPLDWEFRGSLVMEVVQRRDLS